LSPDRFKVQAVKILVPCFNDDDRNEMHPLTVSPGSCSARHYHAGYGMPPTSEGEIVMNCFQKNGVKPPKCYLMKLAIITNNNYGFDKLTAGECLGVLGKEEVKTMKEALGIGRRMFKQKEAPLRRKEAGFPWFWHDAEALKGLL
jgi:hypothetical protein